MPQPPLCARRAARRHRRAPRLVDVPHTPELFRGEPLALFVVEIEFLHCSGFGRLLVRRVDRLSERRLEKKRSSLLVRFAPKADKQDAIALRPLCANRVLKRRSKKHRYSITASAVSSGRSGGTSVRGCCGRMAVPDRAGGTGPAWPPPCRAPPPIPSP